MKKSSLKIGERIRVRREELQLSQAALAEAIGDGVTQAYISTWERGGAPRSHRLVAIAAALEMSVSDLLG